LKDLQCFETFSRCWSDRSLELTEVRKAILKIFFALTQYVLPMELISREFFTKWMEVICIIIEQDLPEEALDPNIDEEDRPQLIW
jgi:hypothetical protein